MPITVPVGYDTAGASLERQLTSDATKAGRSAGAAGGKNFSAGLIDGARRAAGIGAVIGLGGVIKQSIDLEATFSRTMAQVTAATGAPASAISDLSALAMKLGADTSFSANEASSAMLELAKAGISTSDIMGGALSGTLLLASAGSTDLGTAATIASNAMNVFSLSGDKMNVVAAALAGGANASSASVESLGQALSQVGPGAVNAGLSLQQTVGVLSAFDAAGIKGSDAGTSLKTMLTRLIPTTKKQAVAMEDLGLKFTDATGKFLPITNVAQQLKTQLGGLSEEQRSLALTTIFGSDATRAATVLYNEGAKGIGEYIRATKDQNAAQDLAKANMSGTAGALERLSGAVETAQLALGQALAPTIQDVAGFLSEKAVPALTDLITGFQEGTGAGGEIRGVLEDVGDGLEIVFKTGTKVVQFFDSLPGPVKSTAVQLGVAYVALGKVRVVTDLVTQSSLRAAAAFTAVKVTSTQAAVATDRYTANSVAVAARNAAMTTSTTTSSAAMLGLKSAAASAAGVGGLLAITKGATEANNGLALLELTAGGAALGFSLGGPFGALIGGGVGAIASLTKTLFDSGETAQKASPKFSDYASSLDSVTGASTRATRQLILQDLQTNHVLDATRALGISDRLVVRGVANTGNARAKLAAELGNQAAAADNLYRTEIAGLNAGNRLDQQSIAIAREKRDATLENIGTIQKQIGVVDSQTLSQLQANYATATGAKETREAKKALEEYGRVHATPTVELIGGGNVADTIKSIQRAANNLDGKTVRLTVTASTNANLAELAALSKKGRERGGPVRAGQPYVVGERRPELFVPAQNGRIIPQVPAASAPRAQTPAAPVRENITIVQNYNGPQSSRAQISEMEWALRYGTRARVQGDYAYA